MKETATRKARRPHRWRVKNWKEDKICVPKVESITKKGEGGRRTCQWAKWYGKKRREGKWKKKKWKKKKKKRFKEMRWSKKCRKLAESLFAKNAGENKKEKAGRWKCRQPKVRWTLAKFGKWLFIVLMIGQSLVACSIG